MDFFAVPSAANLISVGFDVMVGLLRGKRSLGTAGPAVGGRRGHFPRWAKPCSIVAEASLWKNTAKVGDDGVGEVHIGSDSPGLLCCVSAAALPIVRCAARRDNFLPYEQAASASCIVRLMNVPPRPCDSTSGLGGCSGVETE